MSERFHEHAYVATHRAQCTRYPYSGYKVPQMPMCFIRGLGKGGNGTVYLVKECPSMKVAVAYLPAKRCAVKVLEKDMHLMSKILREVDYHFQLSCHPNILQPYAAWENNTSVFVASEYVKEGDFARFLKHYGHIVSRDDTFLKSLFLQLLDAVAHMHDLGIYHGDLKLENILCKREKGGFHLLLTDFGTSTTKRCIYHRTGYLIGTRYYIPPECYPSRENRLVLPYAMDIWALGVILYITCTGSIPWGYADPRHDACYYTFITNSEHFWSGIPLSRAAKALLKIIWQSKPERRMNIHELRAMIQDMTAFTTRYPKCLAEFVMPAYEFAGSYTNERCNHGTKAQMPIEPPFTRMPKIFADCQKSEVAPVAPRPIHKPGEYKNASFILQITVPRFADEIHETGEAILEWFDHEV